MKILLVLGLIALLLIFPEDASQAAIQALRVWGLDVVPSLFPYMVLSRMLSSGLRARHVPAGFAACFLGLMGGSPSGAAALSSYETRISRKDLLSLSALTGCVSPMFLLHTVARWAQDALFGRLLLASHLIAAFVSCLFVRAFASRAGSSGSAPSVCEAPSESPISESVTAVLNVGGCIIFFSVMAAVCTRLLPFLSQAQRAVLHGILEVSGGLHAILAAPIPRAVQYTLCAAISGFSGLSILSQNHFFLRTTGVSFAHLVIFGLIRALIAGCAMLILLACFM